MEEHEEFEQIPWSELTTRPPDGRRRLIYLVAGGLGALILVVLVARAFMSSSPADPVAPSITLAQTETTATTSAAVPTTAAPASPAPSLLYREADLMAFPATPGERAAVARAEWFVTDYFTADLEPTGSADVRAALPGGAAMPEMPQDSAPGASPTSSGPAPSGWRRSARAATGSGWCSARWAPRRSGASTGCRCGQSR